METTDPKAGASPSITPAQLDAITAALVERNRLDAIPKSAPKVEQSDEAALDAVIKRARERHSAAPDKAAKRDVEDEVERAIERFEGDRAAKATRKTEYSIADAREMFTDSLKMVKAETKGLFGALGRARALSSPDFEFNYGEGVTPLTAFMNGAIKAAPHGQRGIQVFAPAADEEVVCEARDLNDAYIIWAHAKAAKNGYMPDPRGFPFWKKFQGAMQSMLVALVGKAAAADTADSSAFVPTGFSAELLRRYDMKRQLVSALRTLQVPRFPFQLTGVGAIMTPVAISETTDDPAVTTNNVGSMIQTPRAVSFSRHVFGGRYPFSYDLEEDAIIPQMQFARDELGAGIVNSEEQFIVDGDTASPHKDVDVTAATDIRKLVKGLRHTALTRSFVTDFAATYTSDKLGQMMQNMNEFVADPGDCIWIGPPAIASKNRNLKDSSGNAVMIGVPNAGFINAATQAPIDQLLGVRYVTMQKYRRNLNATGFYDGTTTSNTSILLVNTTRWIYAFNAQAPMVESQRWMRSRQVEIQATITRDFVAIDDVSVSTNRIVECGYGIAN